MLESQTITLTITTTTNLRPHLIEVQTLVVNVSRKEPPGLPINIPYRIRHRHPVSRYTMTRSARYIALHRLLNFNDAAYQDEHPCNPHRSRCPKQDGWSHIQSSTAALAIKLPDLRIFDTTTSGGPYALSAVGSP